VNSASLESEGFRRRQGGLKAGWVWFESMYSSLQNPALRSSRPKRNGVHRSSNTEMRRIRGQERSPNRDAANLPLEGRSKVDGPTGASTFGRGAATSQLERPSRVCPLRQLPEFLATNRRLAHTDQLTDQAGRPGERSRPAWWPRRGVSGDRPEKRAANRQGTGNPAWPGLSLWLEMRVETEFRISRNPGPLYLHMSGLRRKKQLLSRSPKRNREARGSLHRRAREVYPRNILRSSAALTVRSSSDDRDPPGDCDRLGGLYGRHISRSGERIADKSLGSMLVHACLDSHRFSMPNAEVDGR
jgi:hypothetical protein